MTTEPTRPVLVTGSHRSGSTWVGRMLAAADELHYVQEPFNIVAHQRWLRPTPPKQFLYIAADNEREWLDPVRRVFELRYPLGRNLVDRRGPRSSMRRTVRIAQDARQARRGGAAALVKDPIAIFSTPWLAERFGARAVVLVREPVAFVGSLKERGWTFDFSHWSSQPALMRDVLSRWRMEVEAMVAQPGDIIDQGILMWNAIYAFVAELAGTDDVSIIRYEDVASNPQVEVESMYRGLGLAFGAAQRRAVESLTTEGGQGRSAIDVRRDSQAAIATGRARLESAEIDRVQAGTQQVAAEMEAVL